MKSFLNAARGFCRVFMSERHMRVHLCFVFYVIIAGLTVGLDTAEWGVLLICCGAVIGLECANTALERLCDRVTTQRDELIGRAKDAAAAAVLTCSLFSAAAGCVIFFSRGRPQMALDFFVSNPVCTAVLVLSLILWVLLIFGRRNK